MGSLWRYPFLLKELVKRDLKGRYAGSAGGFAWSFVHPLLSLLLYTFVFSVILKVSVAGERGTESFALFLFAGLLPWLAIQEGLSRGSTAIVDNGALVKKLSFPAEILISSIVLSSFVHQLIATAVFVVVLAILGKLSPALVLLLVLIVPLQLLMTHGLSCLFASANIFFRDTSQALSAVFMLWFYLTPIVFPAALVPERFRVWLDFNPLTHLVAWYRTALLGQPFPALGGTLYLTAFALIVFFGGVRVFRTLEPAFADLV